MKQAGKNNLANVFTTFRQQLLNFIRCRISSEEDANDLLQDVFLSFLQTEENESIEKISSWLYRVTRNRIIDYRRKKGMATLNEPYYDEEEHDGDDLPVKEITGILMENDGYPEDELLRKLIWEEIEDALDELPKEQREIFEQTEFENKSYNDIAAATNVPINTLLSRKHYAVLYLRKRLKQIYEAILYDH
ncbi:MAG: RNA polymerase sigma factor [Bacteroidales bacterium]|jgi:RNA polymerase sigma factor (sigma-70 family)|nr:RNA polymerase sigma factor [Bacteroidales bacterium]MCI2145396.1 RNA polymerase sigma factor [Bacteroidales bacterium]